MNCQFCDCPKYGFYGNATLDDLRYQIETILQNEAVNHTDRFNVHFARMGEPTFNQNILVFAQDELRDLVGKYITAKTVHPVVSTMDYQGEAGLQFSINSTDDKQRNFQFNNKSLSLTEISELAEKLPMPVGRKYTLNFAVTKDTILDAKVLTNLFSLQKFIVKITPIHETHSAIQIGFDVTTSYDDYDVYRQFERPLIQMGWDVIVFVPSREEDQDRITCGNALISGM